MSADDSTHIAGNVFLEQLFTFRAVDRDSRERFVSVDVPRLAFDHAEILQTSIERLRGKLRYQPTASSFEL